MRCAVKLASTTENRRWAFGTKNSYFATVAQRQCTRFVSGLLGVQLPSVALEIGNNNVAVTNNTILALDVYDSGEVVCPRCFRKYGVRWSTEYGDPYDGEYLVACDCGQKFRLIVNIVVVYTTDIVIGGIDCAH